MSMYTDLSVLIPTYNRKDGLLRTLQALQDQFHNDFKIVIVDNASSYSIESEIFPYLKDSFIEWITVFHRKYNIGMGNNIAGLFSYCETKWGWLLGDDDIIMENAIKIIKKNIESHPDYAGFWFSLDNSFSDRIIVDTPEQLINLKMERNLFNDSCYLSNKVYNFEYINLFSDVIYSYAYTMISFSLAIFEILKYNIKYEVIFDEKVVLHPGFKDNKPTWDYIRVANGMRTVVDYSASKDYKEQKKYIQKCFFPWKRMICSYLLGDKEPDFNYFLKILFYDCYSIYLKQPEKLLCKIIINFVSTNIGFKIAKYLYFKTHRIPS